jgi:hypothetical protein
MLNVSVLILRYCRFSIDVVDLCVYVCIHIATRMANNKRGLNCQLDLLDTDTQLVSALYTRRSLFYTHTHTHTHTRTDARSIFCHDLNQFSSNGFQRRTFPSLWIPELSVLQPLQLLAD